MCVCANEEQGIRPTHTTRYESRAEPAPIDAPRETGARPHVAARAEPAAPAAPAATARRARIDMASSLAFSEEDEYEGEGEGESAGAPEAVVPGRRVR